MIRLKLQELMDTRGANSRQVSVGTGIRWNTVDDMAKNRAKAWSPENLEKIMVFFGLKQIGELIDYEVGDEHV